MFHRSFKDMYTCVYLQCFLSIIKFFMFHRYVECMFQTKILKEILQKDLGQTVIDQVDPEANISCSDILFTGKLFNGSMTLT